MNVIYLHLTSLLILSAVVAQTGNDDSAAKLAEFLASINKPPVVYGETIPCTTPEGREGICVLERQCLGNVLNVAGKGILVAKQMAECPSSKPKCCEVPSNHPLASTTRTTSSTTTTSTTTTTTTTTARPTTPVPAPTPNVVPNEKRFRTLRKVGCGWRKESGVARSIGGDEALFGEFPWTVAIYKVYNESDEEYLCTGSLIHPRVVLSAGNYFKRKGKWNVRAGEHDLAGSYELYPHQSSEVERTAIHENFNSGNFSHNIALLFLAKEFVLNSIFGHIGIVCLPTQSQVTPIGTSCIATGWGAETVDGSTPHEVMKMVELPIIERGRCQQALRTVANPRLTLDSSVLCAGGESGQDTCRGDGGGPLVCPEPGTRGRYYQAGIVSWGVGCGINLIPGVYTDVAAVRPWIDQQMSNWGLDSSTYTPVN